MQANETNNMEKRKHLSEPQIANDAVLVKSKKLPDETPTVKGYDWNNGLNYDSLLNSYKSCGFQATNFGKAIDEINKMVSILYNAIQSMANKLK